VESYFKNYSSRSKINQLKCGKNYLLVGVPWSWIDSAPTGDLVIDPTTSVGASDDVWLEDNATGLGSSTQVIIGKAANYPKKRTLIKFNTSSVPTNATVLNAQMKLYYYTAVRVGTTAWVDRWVQAHQVLVNWNEAEATDDYRLTSTLWNVNYVGLNDVDAKSAYESTVLFQQDYPKWKQGDSIDSDIASSITMSALIVHEILSGNFSHISGGMSLNLTGLSQERVDQVVNALKEQGYQVNVTYVR
jgi:hypothetical protein